MVKSALGSNFRSKTYGKVGGNELEGPLLSGWNLLCPPASSLSFLMSFGLGGLAVQWHEDEHKC